MPRLLGSDPAPRGHSKAASRHKTLMEEARHLICMFSLTCSRCLGGKPLAGHFFVFGVVVKLVNEWCSDHAIGGVASTREHFATHLA